MDEDYTDIELVITNWTTLRSPSGLKVIGLAYPEQPNYTPYQVCVGIPDEMEEYLQTGRSMAAESGITYTLGGTRHNA